MTTTNRVFVLDKNKKPLMPCRPARARRLLKRGRAVVYRLEPFTIILLDRTYDTCEMQPISLKFDPGSKVTGIALVALFKRGETLIWAANLTHRGELIKDRLQKRRNVLDYRVVEGKYDTVRHVLRIDDVPTDGYLLPSYLA